MVVVMILIIVSILGIGGAQIALMSERGARNDTVYQLAWQSAEAGLMEAEVDIRTGTRQDAFAANTQIAFEDGCGANGTANRGLCLPKSSGSVPTWLAVDLLDDDGPYTEFGDFTSRSFKSGSDGIQPVLPPRYIIEVLDDPDLGGNLAIGKGKKYVYRVTSMGFGPRSEVQAVMQMLFRKE
jgi:type IV pilus assembly protein PilX